MTAATPAHLPRVDLADFAAPGKRSEAVASLGAALTGIGFLSVLAEGLDEAFLRRVYAGWERVFALPEAAKRRYVVGEGGARGYTPFGVEHARDHPHPDLKEFWHVGREGGAGRSNTWPAEVPELRAPTLELYRALESAAATLLRGLAEFFGLPEDTFAGMIAEGDSILRVVHYPPAAPGADPAALRAAPHEDINLITLLCGATDSGLEILARDGGWLAVDAEPGHLVVDAGDMLSRVTNGEVPATTHRVVVPPGAGDRDRFSLPFFVHPYAACPLDVLPRFVTAERPPRTPPITAGEFLRERLREIGFGG